MLADFMSKTLKTMFWVTVTGKFFSEAMILRVHTPCFALFFFSYLLIILFFKSRSASKKIFSRNRQG